MRMLLAAIALTAPTIAAIAGPSLWALAVWVMAIAILMPMQKLPPLTGQVQCSSSSSA